MILKRYITSLTRGGTKRTDDILANAPGQPVLPEDLDKITYRDIVKPSIANNEAVNSEQLNGVLSGVWLADSTMWNATEELDVATRNLKSYVDNALRVMGSSVSRMDSILRTMSDNSAASETFDSLYVERFDTMSGTDNEDTTALVLGGHLELHPINTMNVTANEPMIVSASHPVDSLTKNYDGGIQSLSATTLAPLTGGIEEARINGLVATLAFGLDGTKTFNSLTISFPQGGSLIEVLAVIGGSVVSLYRPSSPEFVQGNKHISLGTTQATQIKVIAADTNADVQHVYNKPKTGVTRKLFRTMLKPPSKKLLHSLTIGQLSSINYTYTLKIGVNLQNTARTEVAKWTSNPITIDGNIRRLKIETAQTEDAGSNISWDVSVNGGSWKKIVRSGDGSVINEPVSIGPDGSGLFRHNANPGIAPQLTGVPSSSTVTSIFNATGDVMTGIQISGLSGGVVYANYVAAENQQFITFDDVDTVNGVRIVDAMTNGELGEKFTATINRSVILDSDPVTSPEVYVSGVKAVNLDTVNPDTSLDDPTLDLNTVYFRISGRKISFAKEQSSISVYYKHMRSSVVVKATLNRGVLPSSTPKADSVAIGIVHN